MPIYIYICIYKGVCVYIYIHTHRYIHIYIYLLNISNTRKKNIFLLGSSGPARFSLNHTRNQLDGATRKQLRRPFKIALRPIFARARSDRERFRTILADFATLPSPSLSASKFSRTSLRNRQFCQIWSGSDQVRSA